MFAKKKNKMKNERRTEQRGVIELEKMLRWVKDANKN